MNVFLTLWFFIPSFFSATLAMADGDNEQQAPQAAEHQSIITLDGKIQQSSGIETITLKPAHHQAEFIAYGKAISVQPLLALQHRYRIALTEHKRASARLIQAEQAGKRLQDLYRNGITAKRNVQEQQAQWQSDKAQLDAIQYQSQSIIDETLLNWGNVLSDWTLSLHSDKLNAFLSGKKTLLQITLAGNRQLADNNLTIYVDPSGNRSKAQAAELVSTAPQTDAANQGSSYFFQTGNSNIKTGMNISAWIPEQQSLPGVIIPKSALIWFMDQASVYIKTGSDTFSRRSVNDYSAYADGYFISDTVKPGEQIVTTGVQMLLSEELREQIPDED